MLLSLKFDGDLLRVKLEPPDVACLPQQGQVQRRHCDQPPSGGATPGRCRIKEEPREESSNEDPITAVKTEPYNVGIIAEQEQMGHSCGSASQGVTAGMCHIKEEPREDSLNEHPIIEVKTEPYNIAVLTEQDQMGHNCDSTSEECHPAESQVNTHDQAALQVQCLLCEVQPRQRNWGITCRGTQV
ncbi:uncharacterized protein LOC135378842 isoform X3 [Ornithodoros turicata]|uniref:uncharacterized protein LOC135378842 isoform X3 n=1 Tax=Ornithodoros turicata TaxID=34597 RepID=UPI003139591A